MASMLFFMVNTFVFILVITLVTPAEIHRTRHNHRRNHKSSPEQHHSTTEKSQFNPALQHEEYRGELPPHIWALLTANSLVHRNQTNESNENDDDDDDSSKYNEIDFDADFARRIRLEDESARKDAANCPKCKKNNSVKMNQDEVTKLRIDYVKNEILNKLRMMERPPIKEVQDDLPEPVQEGHTMEETIDENANSINLNVDDYFAKTTQKIIFLTQEADKCNQYKSAGTPSLCFSFQIPQDVDINTIESAQLWVYKDSNNLDTGVNHNILLSEAHAGTLKPITFATTNPDNHDWEKIDIAISLKKWVESRQLDSMIHITCDGCTAAEFLPISLHNDTKPFIVIDTIPQRTLTRRRRNINCGPGSSECCRDSLYISFAEIGWGDWIISPKGFHAYFCRGSCSRLASITESGTDHATAIQRLLHSSNNKPHNKQKLSELIPCCTATKYSPLTIIHLDSNNTGNMATLPNMIVESCGCS